MSTTAMGHAGTEAAPAEKKGLWSWITTVDHKRIGILYGVTAFLFFLLGGLEALLIRWQLGAPDKTFLSPEAYNQLFTMHGTTMIFLGVMPLSAMFFNYFIPLQIGARDVAFPRLNAYSYWVFLLRRPVAERELPLQRRPRHGVVRLREPDLEAVQPRPQRRLLDHRPADPRRRLAGGGGQLLRDHHQPARTRHEDDADADVRLDEPHHPGAAAAGLPDHHGGARAADARPELRDPLLRALRRRRPGALAAPLLALRPSRGLHPHPAGLRRRLRDPAGLLAEAALRLRRHGLLGVLHRLPRASGCGVTTCSPPAWGRWRTRSSRSARCSSPSRPA